MARIVSVSLPNEKRLEMGLTYIFGIGKTLSKKIISELKLDPSMRCKDITEDHVRQLKNFIEANFKVEGELKREIMGNIKRLKDIGSFRGSRHIKGLPARGQRTKTNNRTIRGNVRKTIGSGRKPAATAK